MDIYKQLARTEERRNNTLGSGALDYGSKNPQVIEAMRDLRAKADRGDAEAQFKLAEEYHFHADSDFLDQRKALEFFSKSAIQGHSEALKQLKRYAEEGSRDGDGCAEYFLGRTHQHGCGVLKDDIEAAKWMTKAAEAGHREAECILGILYHKGIGVSKHPEEEVKWLCKAAYRGEKEAIKYLKINAEQGFAEAQYNLGYIYDACNSTKLRDEKESVKWYEKAAEQNHTKAQLKLAHIYRYGRSILKDPKKEAAWLHKAASNSDESALILLQRSAEEGVTEAQYSLGFMYAKGEGVLRDMRRAKELLGQAYEKGDSEMKTASKKVSDEHELWKY